MFRISGAAYSPEIDEHRLDSQMRVVLYILSDGEWWTVSEIACVIMECSGIQAPEPSISAQIRNLRKHSNGGYRIIGRYRRGVRIYEYRLEEGRDDGADQGEMF